MSAVSGCCELTVASFVGGFEFLYCLVVRRLPQVWAIRGSLPGCQKSGFKTVCFVASPLDT